MRFRPGDKVLVTGDYWTGQVCVVEDTDALGYDPGVDYLLVDEEGYSDWFEEYELTEWHHE